MKFSYLSIMLMALTAATVTSCSDPSFTIKGDIEKAGDASAVLLEKADNSGVWQTIDSTHLKKGGNFSFHVPAPANPEIYRLVYNGQYAYVPIDSIETVSLKASGNDFAAATLSGTPMAEEMTRFEQDLRRHAPHALNTDSARAFKKHVYSQYLHDSRGSLLSYYILTKTIDGRALFGDPSDLGYISAVATSFREFKPNDPRRPMLEHIATEARRQKRAQSTNAPSTTFVAEEMKYPDINLADINGKTVALSSVVAKGKPVVVFFSQLTNPDTPALNAALRSIAESGRATVYNIGLDSDPVAWRSAARALPFVSVYGGAPNEASSLAMQWQIPALPQIFLINSQGELTARPASVNELKTLL